MKKTFLAFAALCYAASGHAQQFISQTPESIALRNIKDPTELRLKLDKLGLSGTEKDYITLYSYYQVTNRKLADSVANIAISKFPKGYVALNLASKKLMGTDLAQQQKTIEELSTEFPGQDLDRYYLYVAKNSLDQNDIRATLKYLRLTSEKSRYAAMSQLITSAASSEPKLAADYLAEELASANLSEKNRMTLLVLQSSILTQLGDYNEAFKSIQAYYDKTPKKTVYLDANYYYLMSKVGRYAEALPHLEAAVLKMVGGNEVKQELRNAYQKVNPGKDVEAYLSALSKKTDEGKRIEVAKSMINEKAPAFSVLDANGKKVTLADFKGKTIVIDFWATWCGPCKLSLPGMQATVNKYKNDPDVAFLFIHTWEGKDKKGKPASATAAAMKYFTENNYGNLPLYMDLLNENKINPAVSAFKVTGIPAKFVIDGNGNIRFKKEGAGIDVDYAVAELSAMIELSKKGVDAK